MRVKPPAPCFHRVCNCLAVRTACTALLYLEHTEISGGSGDGMTISRDVALWPPRGRSVRAHFYRGPGSQASLQ